jgi:hypothetical protein
MNFAPLAGEKVHGSRDHLRRLPFDASRSETLSFPVLEKVT